MSTARSSATRRHFLAAVSTALLLVVVAACQAPADTTNGQTGSAPSTAGVRA